MNNPKITTVIPTYHRPDLLARAIKSVQLQEFEDWECIVFSDHCPKAHLVYEKYFEDDNRIRFVENPNEWVKNVGAVGVNYALENAKSDIMTYLCDDNIFLPNHFKVICNEHNKGEYHSIQTAGFHFQPVSPQGKKQGDLLIKEILDRGLKDEINLFYHNLSSEGMSHVSPLPDMLRIAHTISTVVDEVGYWLPWHKNPLLFREDTEFIRRLNNSFQKVELNDLTNVYYARMACQARDEDYHTRVANLAPDEIFVYPELAEKDLGI